jgi:hypothetical protein
MFETIYGTERPAEGDGLRDTERELREALVKARRRVWEQTAEGDETPRLRAFGNVVIAAIVGLDALEDLDAAES